MRPSSKSNKLIIRGESIQKTGKSRDFKKEIIRLYTSNSTTRKKVINSINFNCNNLILQTKTNAPSLEKICPSTTKNNNFMKLSNISNNFHKITKNSDSLFFKKKDESNLFDSVSPKMRQKLKLSSNVANKNILKTEKRSFNGDLKSSQPITVSKIIHKSSNEIQEKSNNTGSSWYKLENCFTSAKERIYSVCQANRIKIKQVNLLCFIKLNENLYECEFDKNVFKIEIGENMNEIRWRHLKGNSEITKILLKRLFNI